MEKVRRAIKKIVKLIYKAIVAYFIGKGWVCSRCFRMEMSIEYTHLTMGTATCKRCGNKQVFLTKEATANFTPRFIA